MLETVFARPQWPRALAVATSVAWSCLRCTPAPTTDAARAAERTPAAVPTVLAAPPNTPEAEPEPALAAGRGKPGPAEVERVSRTLFGKMIGPEFAAGEEASLAPPGYKAQAQLWVDFAGNDTEDVLVTLERDPAGDVNDTTKGPACVLVLGIEYAVSRYRVAGINGHGFACSRPSEDTGTNGAEVTFTTSDDEQNLVITVSQGGNMVSEDWSYQVGYDVTTSRFVVSKFDYSTYDRVQMSGERATLYPLEGRGERAANGADPEPVRLPARRVLFEDLDEKIGYELLRF